GMPWFVKIPAKIVLSRMPVRSLRWQRLNLFKAGVMDDPAAAFRLFSTHLEGAGMSALTGKTVLELGPGTVRLQRCLRGLLAQSVLGWWTPKTLRPKTWPYFPEPKKSSRNLGCQYQVWEQLILYPRPCVSLKRNI